ncbi:NfeD family protein [Aestuariimicrobium sp. T2.26MG-19.2B]|uniref:NfeD family protein n=1 Tax=Aestuariimicrobium sp. T2.26MG-19.2B TaxID=3040679 RepID=UPI0024773714|nr:NfeD family protein [Aestuariimicrobium sp. T2.26MG-19.2B]CAI9408284.1 hypothetical protein AESSP_01997 [Aestuariimicrobium sp. T2.26MG-19.2B]
MVFLVVGGIGAAILVLSLVLGDFLQIGDHLGGLLDSDLVSSAAIAAFLGVFGFVGWGVRSATGSTWLAIPVGVVAGLMVGWLLGRLTRALDRNDPTASLNTSSLVGLNATVISDIPSSGFGEVRVNAAGHPLKLNARADGPLPRGTQVWVAGVVSATAVEVRTTDPGDAPTNDTPH